MPELTLVLEASTGTGSVALLRGGALVAETEVAMRGHDGERLMPSVVQLLAERGVPASALARVICGAGPGGFTSLRIAAALAKGVADSLGIELWAASSLALLAASDEGLGDGRGGREPAALAPSGGGDTRSRNVGGSAPSAEDADGAVIAVIDALRGEWYCQRFVRSAEGVIVADGEPGLMARPALASVAAGAGARVVGMGGDTFAGGRNAVPLARDVARLVPGPLLAPVALDTWEPDYGRLAEAQVKWEKAHGRSLGATG
ncbi:MAG: tRNA (adenosine(37)-N6)-threonylcarbamoyltransferase complex dimerization subunit type 1 TsaB [Gemmatimonadetes bacterium SCN 70-22]|mgnify:CR=1 FL=1|nr:MAG: tRNA (adenosine(37)-N6)-threonylcarbamoyltransferase complex dimerization subunit type 1 TsaB [Gemmatimonadetes bacterium SCN 70-22]